MSVFLAVSRFQLHAVPHLARWSVVARRWLWGSVIREGLILSPGWLGIPLIYLDWALGVYPQKWA